MPSTKTIKTKKHIAREKRERQLIRLVIILTVVVGVAILGLVLFGSVSNFILRPRTAVAEVGDKNITVKEFEKQVQYTRVQLLNQVYTYYNYYQQLPDFGTSFLEYAQSIATQLMQTESIGSDVLDEMINDIIIQEEAAARGITVSQDEIDEALYDAFGFYPNGTKTPTMTATIESTPTYSETMLSLLPSTSTPTATVEATETPEVTATPTEEFTEDEASSETITENVAETEESPVDTATPEASPIVTQTPTITLTPTPYTTDIFAEDVDNFNEIYGMYDFEIEDLRDIFEIQLLREKLLEEITQDLEPVKEEVYARHILVETQETADEVLALLEAGDSFVDVAAAYSTDESNSANGGDLGWFDRNTMVAEFTDAAFNLAEGEMSGVVETSYGFHIIQVLGKRESQETADEFAADKEDYFIEWLGEQRDAREDIMINEEWAMYVPDTPEVPQALITELFSQTTATATPSP